MDGLVVGNAKDHSVMKRASLFLLSIKSINQYSIRFQINLLCFSYLQRKDSGQCLGWQATTFDTPVRLGARGAKCVHRIQTLAVRCGMKRGPKRKALPLPAACAGI
jgi:hypothetical protein